MTEFFGDYLARLLPKIGIEVAELAEAVDVDRSLIYKWIRNERVPASDEYLNRILSHCALLEEDEEGLKEAWIETRRLGRDHLPRRRRRTNQAQSLLYQVKQGLPEQVLELASSRRHLELPNVLDDPWTSLSGLASVIRNLPRAPIDGAKLVITYLPEGTDFQQSRLWDSALQAAMAKDWTIEHVVHLDRNQNRAMRIVKAMTRLLNERGLYQPFVSELRPRDTRIHDYIVVPGILALILTASHRKGEMDTAIVLKDQGQIDLLERHVRTLFLDAAPLLRTYSTTINPLDFEEALADSPLLGDQGLIQDGLPTLSEPPTRRADTRRWNSVGSTTNQASQLANLRERRFNNFLNSSYQFRAVCPQDALLRLIHDGEVARDDPAFSLRHKLPISERISWLEHIVHLLRNPRFELALVDNEQADRIGFSPYWLVSGGRKVYIETFSGERHERNGMALEIAHSTVAQGFQESFNDIWYNIPPEDRDRTNVIAKVRCTIDQYRHI